MRKALRRRKARSIGRKFMKAFTKQGIVHACIETSAPHWYFTGDFIVTRESRLRKMARIAEKYIFEATGHTYEIDVTEDISGMICLDATLIPDSFTKPTVSTPTPAQL